MTALKPPHEILADLDTEERELKARLVEIARLRAATTEYLSALDSLPKSFGAGMETTKTEEEAPAKSEANVQKRPSHPPPPPKRRKRSRKASRPILSYTMPETAGELLAQYEAVQQNSDREK